MENWNILSTLIEDKKDDIFLVKCKIYLNWFYKNLKETKSFLKFNGLESL